MHWCATCQTGHVDVVEAKAIHQAQADERERVNVALARRSFCRWAERELASLARMERAIARLG